ncbi:hypothetical protein [Acidocella sp.]|uniref:hypothetical protein n=1 Tax=Acidocella sp. TaxID=50710 RepID=UPI002630648E|nr:hypothetical protein [Acidocella sp.]
MTILWILLIITFVLSAVGMMPTAWYKAMGEWCLTIYRSQSRKAFEKELARLTAQSGFAAETSYFGENIGLAVDRGRGLLFAANLMDGKVSGAVVKLAEIEAVTRGQKRDYGFYDYFIDITAQGQSAPVRVICGERPEKAEEIFTLIGTLKAG